jgi:hypothetical protein
VKDSALKQLQKDFYQDVLTVESVSKSSKFSQYSLPNESLAHRLYQYCLSNHGLDNYD